MDVEVDDYWLVWVLGLGLFRVGFGAVGLALLAHCALEVCAVDYEGFLGEVVAEDVELHDGVFEVFCLAEAVHFEEFCGVEAVLDEGWVFEFEFFALLECDELDGDSAHAWEVAVGEFFD